MRTLRSWAVSGMLFPLQERIKGHDSVKRLHELEKSQWWDRAELNQHRLAKLRELLEYAETHVPYYRELFRNAGFSANQLQSLADLAQLPCLTKAAIKGNTEKLRSDVAGPLQRYNTGGSSGEPLVFFMGKDRVSHDVAAKWRATRWWNVDIGDPEIVVWGSPIEIGRQDRIKALRDSVMRSKLLPAFEMSDAKLDAFVADIRAMRPAMLFGYPSALAHIAQHVKRRGGRMDDLGTKVAFVTGEKLYDHQRAQIAETFGCEVANGYGGRDAGFIAHQCPAGGMHMSAEDIIVETLDSDGKTAPAGQPGEIVVTHLATKEFPFIRYRTGDIAVLDEGACACGRGLPMLREIQGRTTDFVVAQDGTVMHGLALIYVLRDLPEVASFKIIQESRERLRVQVVPIKTLTSALQTQIQRGLKARLGESVDIIVDAVTEIAPEKSGKYRYVISHVAAA